MPCRDERYILALYSEDEDGVVTDRVDLTDGASYGIGPDAVYAPLPSQKVARGADSAYRHGADVVRARYDNSTVEIRELTIKGSAEILAERVMRLTTMLEKARLRQERGWGEKVYIERDWRYSTYYAWDVDPGPEYFYETVDILKKEVYRGEFAPPREDVGAILRDDVLAPCRLSLECYPFWQGRERNIKFEYDVDNHLCDAYPPVKRNYINISSDELPGDAPSLIRVRIMNETVNDTIRTLRMGIKRQCYSVASPCCADLTLQTEDGSYGFAGTDSALQGPGVDFSCDYGVRVSPSDATNKLQMDWDTFGVGIILPRGTYRALLRIRNNDSARTVQAQLRTYGGGQSWFIGSQVEVETHTAAKFVIADLGLIEIPPTNIAQFPEPASYTFALYLQSDAASGTIDIDYMLLLPVEGGVKLTQIPLWAFAPFFNLITLMVPNISCEYNGFLDPPITSLFVPASGVWGALVSEDLGFAAYIEPGQDHCLVFSADVWDGAVGKSYNKLDTAMEVTIDIIPQYFYIR